MTTNMQNRCTWMKDSAVFTNLPSSRTYKSTNKFADYIELLAITSMDGYCTFSMLLDIMSEEDAFTTPNTQEDQLEESLDYSPKVHSNNISQREFGRHLLKCIEYRNDHFSDYWPFTYDKNTRKVTADTDHQYFYLYNCMLLSSLLEIIHQNYRSLFTTFHETLSYEAVKVLFPENAGWSVKYFGANQEYGEFYSGNLKDKFEALAKDLSTCLNPKADFPSSGGDGGLDAIVFRKFLNDDRAMLPISTVQSACTGKGLESKARETSPYRIGSRILLDTTPTNYLITPRDIRSSVNNSKFQIDDNALSIIIDRFRVLPLIDIDVFTLPESLKNMINDFKSLNNNYTY